MGKQLVIKKPSRHLYKAMTPAQKQALNTYLEAIARFEYDESDPGAMTTIEGIELTVREKIQAHVHTLFHKPLLWGGFGDRLSVLE
ncbi:MAG: hypothetical protein HC772_15725 [Leptolyngbyaceae cyanobacterium CRU_2_3]|nr:hypothetical protein [Leptolyngbyaceae cyanobacterium CRU_2_3]